MLAGDDHAVYVGPNEGRLEPPEAWRRVRGGPHRVRRSAGADPRRPEPFRAGGPRNHCGPLDQGPPPPGLLALDVRPDMSVKTMKKRPGPRPRQPKSDLAREYRFDYTKSRSNRFARQIAKNAVVVVLDPDVAAVFRDPRRANSLLRATIAALKKPGSRRAG